MHHQPAKTPLDDINTPCKDQEKMCLEGIITLQLLQRCALIKTL